MASASTGQPASTTPSQSAPQPSSRPASSHAAVPSAPVEMTTLPLPPSAAEPSSTPAPIAESAPVTASRELPSQSTQDAPPSQSTPAVEESIAPSNPSKPTPPADLARTETEAIGPSTDNPVVKLDTASGPVVLITLLLTTGARHPYKIDEKYLKKRSVNVDAMDPYNISVYTLKELIWRDWREEWESRPTSPSSIRLIHFGRMLDDKSPLKECRFQTEAPNVVHMTVKPSELIDDDDTKGGKGGNRRDDGEEIHAGCRCVIL
ncbi:ubiquitin-like protein [Amniculicola lignicola CBS 123094]|uniref:Ubiquitin-like protein n=1 Tax=Amniculicola lignicola CBS 123094 TaxID=1392246 RepID=A0A6A5WPN9_9PLEO|nr:ubiquitin-like protein [Amniculicola lignicola CBS 123094]